MHLHPTLCILSAPPFPSFSARVLLDDDDDDNDVEEDEEELGWHVGDGSKSAAEQWSYVKE